MNLLAIDTATERFSTAVYSDASNGGTWLFEVDAGLRHSELVMDSIDILMQKAALKPEDLDGVVCMGGPGSFTGLRIGFSLAKGLALSLGIPFAPIPTLDCMAWPFSSWPGIVVPALDAKKGAFFCALYRSGAQIAPAMDAAPAEIAQTITAAAQGLPLQGTLLVGPGAQALYEKLPDTANIIAENKLRWGNAETLLRIAAETAIFANTTGNCTAGPEYIRKSDAEIHATTPPGAAAGMAANL